MKDTEKYDRLENPVMSAISERLYFFILSSLYFAGQPCYNGLDPVVGLALDQFGSTVELIFLEECIRGLIYEALEFIIQFGTGYLQSIRNNIDIQFG